MKCLSDFFPAYFKKNEEGVRFYRQLDPENIEHYHKFSNQTSSPKEAVYEDNELYLGEEDTQPELYRNFVGNLEIYKFLRIEICSVLTN